MKKYKIYLHRNINSIHGYIGNNGSFENDNLIENLYLYKGRITNPNSSFLYNDMFHIPLNKRERVSTQRYSIPGVPCIYLGQNSYVCWKELDTPSIDNVAISSYKVIDGTKKIIDLTFPINLYLDNFERTITYLQNPLLSKEILLKTLEMDKKIRRGYQLQKNKEETIVWTEKCKNTIKMLRQTKKNEIELNRLITHFNILEIYPLIAFCSVKCLSEGRKHKSEYVLPQLLMNCLSTSSLIGIAFRSNRIHTNTNMYATNLAIPILTKTSAGSKYSKIFELTDSFNLGYFNIIRNTLNLNQLPISSSFSNLLEHNNNGRYVFKYDGHSNYSKTLFNEFDNYIVNMKFNIIK